MSQFNINPQLTSIIQEVGPCEGGLVAEKILPTVAAPACTFGWVDFKCTNEYDNYEDKVGCYSAPNEIDGPVWEYKYDKVQARYLSTLICELDLACHNAGGCNNPTFDIEAMHMMMLFNKLRLAREVRVLNKAFDATNYVADENLFDFAGILDKEDGLQKLSEIIDCSKYGFNCLVIGKKLASKLQYKAAFNNKNCCTPNFGLRQNLDNIANLIGIQEIVVSDTCINVAPKGMPKDLQQVLDNDALLIRNNNLPGTDCPTRTYGFTAQFRDTYAAREIDGCKGGRGAIRLKAGWEIGEVFADFGMGTLLQNLCASTKAKKK